MSVRLPPLFAPLLAAAAAALVVTRQPVSDSDLFWHLAYGRDLLAGAAVGVERYSWTVPGVPIALDQWLGDIALFLAHAAGGWRGIVVLRAVVVAAFTAVVVATAIAAAPRRPLIALVAALPAIVLSRYAWTDRPELFGLLCFAILVALLRTDDDRRLIAVPVLLLVWSALHGSYALGVGLTLVVLAERALRRPATSARGLLVAAGALVPTVLSVARYGTAPAGQFWSPPRAIAEWSVPDVTGMPGLVFGVVLGVALAAALLSPARTATDLAILVPTAFVSLTAARHMPFFAIAAVPFLAHAAADAWGRRRGSPAARSPGRAADLVAALVLAVVLGLAVATAPAEPDLEGYPVAAVAALPRGPGVLAQYDWGGFLIWFAPATPVFVDGRLLPYVPDVLADYRTIIAARPGWEGVAERRGVRAILVRPRDAIAVRAPERGWRVAYVDATAVLLVR